MINKFRFYRVLFTLSFSTLFVSGNASASPQVWTEASDTQSAPATTKSTINHRSLTLDVSLLKDQLNTGLPQLQAKTEAKIEAKNALDASANPASTASEIEIPLPQGGTIRVKAEPISIMATELAAKYPHLKTWRVTGVDDETITGVIDTTEHGFHAMLTMPDGDTVFIDPDKNSQNYLSFSKHANKSLFENKFQCGATQDDVTANAPLQIQSSRLMAKSAPATIIYNLAVATTGEYTQFHGGTVGAALSAIVTTISRVNEVFKRDLGIQLRLVNEQERLIYTNGNTDPYSNNDVNALIDENVDNLSSAGVLDRSRFDIGHVFSTGNYSGLAWAGAACNGDKKARGTSGISNPEGDTFDLDFVAHEIGHQLGATHTFNGSCGNGQRTQVTAVEPGSGSTIMSYAGVCAPDNLQNSVDAQFHAASIIQIYHYTRKDIGSQCGLSINSSNNDPQVSAGSDYTIPTQTPFMLKASGSDSDGDKLSYTWEQSDTGTESRVDVDTGDNALIRSRPASFSKTRYIPRLADLFKGEGARGERLPVNDRDMHFMATVRDGKGGVEVDEMKMKISSTGRTFSIISQRSDTTLFAGEEITVMWDPAGTNLPPISCDAVDIDFIEADGTKSHLSSTANDGDKTLTIPSSVLEMRNARLMVSCSDNLFFNVSSGNLKILNGDKPSDSSGGSTGFIFLPLMFIALLRRRILLGNNAGKYRGSK